MAFKGTIPKGSRVEAELSVDNAASGTALLSIGFVDNGGGQGAKSRTIAKGGADTVEVQTNPEPTGLLRVVVDFKSESDGGQLTVRVNGNVRNNESIEGDTTWSYSLQ
jgi:hypothetical protein